MNTEITIDELMAEIGRLHVQILGLQKRLFEVQQLVPAKTEDKPAEQK
jgi:hypothetical protein